MLNDGSSIRTKDVNDHCFNGNNCIHYVFNKRNATASDFFVGGRSFGWFTNGSAIGGDYLSAATFLGIAGLTFQLGYDGAYYAFASPLG